MRNDELISMADFAEYLGVSERTLQNRKYNVVKHKREITFPCRVNAGKKALYLKSELIAWNKKFNERVHRYEESDVMTRFACDYKKLVSDKSTLNISLAQQFIRGAL